MSIPQSAGSARRLITRDNTNLVNNNEDVNRQNAFLRSQSNLSAKDIGYKKVLTKDAEVTEETVYQLDVENPELMRIGKRSELASKSTCLTQRWQTAAAIGIVLLVLAGAIGGLAYWITLPKVITQPFLLYGQSCYMNSRSCDATRMLWCPSGTCICTGNYQWNATAQNCSCGASQTWTGFKCQGYGSYGDPCNTIPCLPTLTCQAVVSQTYSTGQAICSCDNTTYLDTVTGSSTVGKCIPRLTYNANCLTVTDCQTWVGLSCTSATSGTKCQCDSTSYWNGSICIQNARGWQPCSLTIPCDTTRGLTCDSMTSTCQCDQLSYWDNVTTQWCQQTKSYAISCQYSFQCNTTVGLSCPSVSSGCNCPTTSYSGMCDCQTGKFWDGQRCSNTHSFNATCPGQYACITSGNLVCYLGHCICPGNMVWGSGPCACASGTSWNTTSNSCV